MPCRAAGLRFSGLPLSFAWVSKTLPFVGSSTQSSRRSTVSGRMTSGYLARLKESRSRSATDQMNETLSPKLFIE